MKLGETPEFTRGVMAATAAGAIFTIGGGEPLSEGTRITAFGLRPFGGRDRLLRIGSLDLLLPSGGDSAFMQRIRSQEEPISAIMQEIARSLDDSEEAWESDPRSASLIADWMFLRGFSVGLKQFNLIPTIEEQRIDGSENPVAILLCATQGSVEESR